MRISVWILMIVMMLFGSVIKEINAQSVRVYPTMDAVVDEQRDSENMGAGVLLGVKVKSFNGGNVSERTLIKFDLSPIPTGKEITGAYLYIYQKEGATGETSAKINVLRLTGNWGENLVTWSNQPSFVSYGSQYLNLANGLKKINVTDLVRRWYKNEWTNWGLGLAPGDTTKIFSRLFSSREAQLRNLYIEVDYASASDNSGPLVSQLSVTPDKTAANIKWMTDEMLKTAEVHYGTSTAYGKVTSGTVSNKSHAANLVGLNTDTTYYYKIKSIDYAGNITETKGSFKTGAASVSSTITSLSKETGLTNYFTPVSISQVGVTNISSGGATIFWTTNIAATSKVLYGESRTSVTKTAVTSGTTTKHQVTLSGLKSDTTYFYYVSSTAGSSTKTYPSDPVPFKTEKISYVNFSGTTGATNTRDLTGLNTTAGSVGTTTSGTELVIYPPTVKNITDTSAKIEWVTNKSADGKVKYWKADGGITTTVPIVGTGTFHTTTLTGLIPNTEYHYWVQSVTVRGEIDNSITYIFKTGITGGVGETIPEIPPEEDTGVGGDPGEPGSPVNGDNPLTEEVGDNNEVITDESYESESLDGNLAPENAEVENQNPLTSLAKRIAQVSTGSSPLKKIGAVLTTTGSQSNTLSWVIIGLLIVLIFVVLMVLIRLGKKTSGGEIARPESSIKKQGHKPPKNKV